MAWCVVVERRTLRECRIALGQSQTAFAAMLGVSPESYRTWDAGRRAAPLKMLARARALATPRNDHALLPLPVLALLIGVHVKTLRAAARDGRLPVTYDTKTTFRRLRARATPAAARAFRRSYYGRPVKPVDRRAPLTWASVPDDYDVQIRMLRRARGLSQAQLATLVGAETHAVAPVLATNRRAPRVGGQPLHNGRSHSGCVWTTLAPRGLHRKEMVADLAAGMNASLASGLRPAASQPNSSLAERWVRGASINRPRTSPVAPPFSLEPSGPAWSVEHRTSNVSTCATPSAKVWRTE